MEYKGYKVISNEEEVTRFYQKEYPIDDLNENEYLLIANENGEIVDKYYIHDGKYEQVRWTPIKNRWIGEIKPLTITQELGFHMLQTAPSTLKVFNSSYGVGKSFLSAAYTLSCLEKGIYNKAILIRPNIGVKDYPSLGLVPGTYNEKAMPWFAMLGDIMGSMDAVQDLVDEGKLEFAPIETLRGRTFTDSIILVEECGNLTTALCRLIVSRCAKHSIIIMCGDESQADRERFKEDCGIKNMTEKLAGHRLFSYLSMEGCVRSETAQLSELF